MRAKTWDELEFKDDFIFGKVMRNPELCRKMLETILDIRISHIDYPEAQKVIDITMDAKSVRLDVYSADEKGAVYNVEMQSLPKDNLPKRSRYYGDMIDLGLIEKGARYSELNRSYVIFICDFDLFGFGRHIYTFKNICTEDSQICLHDGTTKIFLNTTGTLNDVSKGLRAFLDYVHGGDVSDDRFVQELDKAVEKARTNREWRREYMTLYMWQQEIQEESRAEGLAAGRAEGLSQGLAQGRTEGGWLNIISIIRKKLIKQISPEDTADMLELDIAVVEDIMNCIREHGDFDDEQIFAEVFGGK